MDETCSESEIHLAILKFEIRKIIPSWIFWINITRYLFTTRSLLFLLLNILDVQYKKKKERENFKRSFHKNIFDTPDSQFLLKRSFIHSQFTLVRIEIPHCFHPNSNNGTNERPPICRAQPFRSVVY